MKIKYLNYSQASAISSDHQHLIGSPFNRNNEGGSIVREVMVAPYSRILQWQFLRDIHRGAPHHEALSICCNGRYDVLVLSNGRYTLAKGFEVKDLRTYLAENNLDFNLKLYSCLRMH